jgi:hypothetical protein
VGHRLSVIGIALALALPQPQTPQRFKSSIDVSAVDYVARAVIAIGSRDVGRVTRPFRIPKAAANPDQ